mgnify:CR=1 FL=1
MKVKTMNKKFRTVWISDLHIGSKGCQAEEILKFLDTVKFDTLILNGDIIDGWRLKSKWYFPQSHLNVIRKILSLARKGKNIIYVSGNHDEFLRGFHEFDLTLGNIKIVNKYEHETSDGRKFLTVHGDAFDAIVKYHKWVAFLGDIGYNFLIFINTHFNRLRKMLGLRYWSLSKFIKYNVKKASNFINKFEESAARASGDREGIICGHIHHPELAYYNQKLYINSGDWVETCSWVGENENGKLEVWEWKDGNPVKIAIEEDS